MKIENHIKSNLKFHFDNLKFGFDQTKCFTDHYLLNKLNNVIKKRKITINVEKLNY